MSYRVAKWHEISGSMHDFQVQYIRTLAANVLKLNFPTFYLTFLVNTSVPKIYVIMNLVFIVAVHPPRRI